MPRRPTVPRKQKDEQVPANRTTARLTAHLN